MGTYTDYMKTRSTETPAFDSAKNGERDSIRGYINAGGDVNVKNHQGHSLLMLAAYYGHVEICQDLIEAGADVNSTDEFGNSILMGVSFKGHSDVVRLLIAHGAQIQAANKAGQTALMYAQLFGRSEVVSLLEGGARPARKIHFYQQIFTALQILALGFTSKFKRGVQHV